MLIELLARTSKTDKARLQKLADTADVRYKVYEIPKRSGGMRTIHHPSRELKAVQRWLVKIIFDRFPVHQSATAYRVGSGIRENAEMHRQTRYTNRYDFSNFFPSFKESHISEFLKLNCPEIGLQLSDQDLDFVCKIVCRKGGLTIGAPSSPAITNTMMFSFDNVLSTRCKERNLVYTRYADDIFVSSYETGQLTGLENVIQSIKRDISYLHLRLNRQKTSYLSKKYRRSITGVVVTSEHKLSIGRARKREIKALIHQWLTIGLDFEKVYYLRGLLAFARDIEPEFERRLQNKYSEPVIRSILNSGDLGVKASTSAIHYWQMVKELS